MIEIFIIFNHRLHRKKLQKFHENWVVVCGDDVACRVNLRVPGNLDCSLVDDVGPVVAGIVDVAGGPLG